MTQQIELTKAQRAAAIDRIAHSLALRSGAGCGKTFVLARRYIELLKASAPGSNPLGELVALTFTDKAALEMSQRVRKMLVELAASSDPDLRERARTWIDQLGDARIGTIHSFCSALLRANAVEAGVDPGFAVCADALQAARMLAEAADDACLEAIEAEQADAAQLLSRMNYEQLVTTVADLVNLRTTCALEEYLDPQETLQRWEKLLQACAKRQWDALTTDKAYRTALDEAEKYVCSDPQDKLELFRCQQLQLIRRLLNEPASRTSENMALLNDKPGGIGAAAAWGGKDMPKTVRDALREVVGRAIDLRRYAQPLNDLDTQAAGSLAALCRLALRAQDRYARAKRSAGLLDFTDLLYHACRLLREKPALRRRLAGQIRQLLIDECQDTDSFQVELLMMLVDPDAKSGQADLPEGRLFLVGDAKQSIYRFRGAQLEVFEDLCRRLGPSRQENLDLSFRSHPGITTFVNHLFEPLMEADYSPIDARRAVVPPGGSVEILLAEGDAAIERAAQASRAQAQAVAQRIRRMLDDRESRVWNAKAQAWRPVRPGDIAILFSRMTNSLQYEQELQKLEIPYYVLAGMGFFQQQEVFDVLNALRAVDNPLDDIALLGLLRSSLVGLDDNALLHLARAYAPPYFPALRAELLAGRTPLAGTLPDDQASALARAADMLAALHRRKDAVGIDRTLADLLDQTAYEATLLAQFQGKRMLGNVRMLLEQAAAAARQGTCLADFVAQMDELVAAEHRYEQAAVEGEAEDVVRIMTIHKAKGLEFPVVFVPDLNMGRQAPKGPLLLRRDWGLTLKAHVEDDSDQEAVSHAIAREMEAQDQAREDIRKFYVALTRAEDYLVLVAAHWRTQEGEFKNSGSYLEKMDQVLCVRAALDGGQEALPYGPGGKMQAAVRLAPPEKRTGAGGGKSRGAKMLAESASAEDLGRRMLQAAAQARPGEALDDLVGPLPARTGCAEIAVTALSQFDHCPMLYRWCYELGVPDLEHPARPGVPATPDARTNQPPPPAPRRALLDPATLGTVLHRCMELVDFARPQPAQELARQVLTEMELDEAATEAAVTADLATLLRSFQAHPLWKQIASARTVHRELDFVLAGPGAVLRGQIDLLFEDQAGLWHLVDYKSDRVGPEGAQAHAEGYRLQMHAYALAGRRFHGQAPADARLFFLRPAAEVALPLDERSLAEASARMEELIGRLNAARRSGRFEPRPGITCEYCAYRALCQKAF